MPTDKLSHQSSLTICWICGMSTSLSKFSMWPDLPLKFHGCILERNKENAPKCKTPWKRMKEGFPSFWLVQRDNFLGKAHNEKTLGQIVFATISVLMQFCKSRASRWILAGTSKIIFQLCWNHICSEQFRMPPIGHFEAFPTVHEWKSNIIQCCAWLTVYSYNTTMYCIFVLWLRMIHSWIF